MAVHAGFFSRLFLLALLSLYWKLASADLADVSLIDVGISEGCVECSAGEEPPNVLLLQQSLTAAPAKIAGNSSITAGSNLGLNQSSDSFLAALFDAGLHGDKPGAHLGDRCIDQETYLDPHGKMCFSWRGKDCSQAHNQSGYELWEQNQLKQACPLSCGLCRPTAADFTGVTSNSAGDFDVFVTAVCTNTAVFLICVAVFTYLTTKYPLMYSNNLQFNSNLEIPDGWFAWITASLSTSPEQAQATAGLDASMMITFCEFAMKLMFYISLPNLVMMPFYYHRGHAPGTDTLARVGMDNVLIDHPWLYWCDLCSLWYTTGVVIYMTRAAQRDFLKRRFQWLQRRPLPDTNSLMVSGIAKQWRSDDRLKEYFAKSFFHVKSAYVVKKIGKLETLVKHRNMFAFKCREAQLRWEKSDDGCRPMAKEKYFSEEEDAIKLYERLQKEYDVEIVQERARIEKEASSTIGGSIYGDCGFVTFSDNREAVLAKSGLIISANASEWCIEYPPEPNEVRWSDLKAANWNSAASELLGYLSAAGIYFGFTPICLFVTNLAYTVEVPDQFKSAWGAFAPTIGLLIFVNFLPTVFLAIFENFFRLKAERWQQYKLQEWYFWFQIFFVLLVSAVGQSISQFIYKLIDTPSSIFIVLASQLPSTTHFYMNYLVVQWSTHGMNLTRHTQLGKFLVFRKLYEDKEALQLAEPESQDYYGIGGRSARFTIFLVIGLVFSTLAPITALLASVNFAISRVVYGYLLVFAETPKADLGGAFFVKMLNHVHYGLFIYLTLMIGVLNIRPFSSYPMTMAAPTLPLAIYAYYRFQWDFQWERLPFECAGSLGVHAHYETGQVYIQPELDENYDWAKTTNTPRHAHFLKNTDKSGAAADKIMASLDASDDEHQKGSGLLQPSTGRN